MAKSESRRLLILACSARKTAATAPMPAWDLYDGVAYRMLKRLRREATFPRDVDVVILSAKYGIISPTARIAAYDQRMDPATAKRHVARNAQALRRRLAGATYTTVYLFMGADYRRALSPFNAWRGDSIVRTYRGRIGEQLHRLKHWLLSPTCSPA